MALKERTTATAIVFNIDAIMPQIERSVVEKRRGQRKNVTG